MDKLLELGVKAIESAPPEAAKPLVVVIGSVLLAEKFETPDWLETIKEQK